MNQKEFIEKAIEGGYKGKTNIGYDCWFNDIILDPKAWEAVGKVEGWKGEIELDEYEYGHWTERMHEMIDHLIEGGTIDSYLKTL
jgi:hypothetical protein